MHDTNADKLLQKPGRRKSDRKLQMALVVDQPSNNLTLEYLSSWFTENHRNKFRYTSRDSVKKLAVPMPRNSYTLSKFRK